MTSSRPRSSRGSSLPARSARYHSNRAGFEHRERRAAVCRVVVHQRRDLVVGRDGEELGTELLAAAEVHRDDAMLEARLFETQPQLQAVRRGAAVVQIDHGSMIACEPVLEIDIRLPAHGSRTLLRELHADLRAAIVDCVLQRS
jgi:hypothetical protein